MSQVKFSIFADFHYFQPSYPVTLEHLNTVLKRAADEKVDFVVQLGDFCNDFPASPEIVNGYIHNDYGLTAYGVYGGHDLEYVEFSGKDLPRDNTMAPVTCKLNSDSDSVIWGTSDGKIGDGHIGYYYFDRDGFRFIAVDSQYSWNPEVEAWEKNITYHPRKGNTRGDRLGDVQLAWLDGVLTDAAHKGLACIIWAHSPAWHGFFEKEPEAEVRELFDRVNAIRKGTVMMCANGHVHTDRPMLLKDNILFFDVNATINAWWMGAKAKPHYGPEHTFLYTEYDDEGNPVKSYEKSYPQLWQGQNTWFTVDPLDAIVTVDTDGTVTVEGKESSWVYGVNPEMPDDAYFAKCFVHTAPRISSGTYAIER